MTMRKRENLCHSKHHLALMAQARSKSLSMTDIYLAPCKKTICMVGPHPKNHRIYPWNNMIYSNFPSSNLDPLILDAILKNSRKSLHVIRGSQCEA